MVGAHILFQTTSADLMSLDLHGRGYSEISEKGSDINLYIIQLALLLQYVGWESAYVVGFSMVISNSTHAIPVGVDMTPGWRYRERLLPYISSSRQWKGGVHRISGINQGTSHLSSSLSPSQSL